MLPTTEHIALAQENGVLRLTLNRPQVRNAITRQMVAEIQQTFAALQGTDVRVVVIRGAGENFCAGGDLKDLSQYLKTVEGNELENIAAYSALAGEMFATVNSAAQAVVAILEGAVLGGGLGLAVAADIVIASKSAQLSLPEARRGLAPVQIAPFILRKVGESYARMLTILADRIDLELAQRIGLVHYVVDRHEIETTLSDILSKINACAPQALALSKEMMLVDGAHSHKSAAELGRIFAQMATSDEAKEGMAAFNEKRKPSWSR